MRTPKTIRARRSLRGILPLMLTLSLVWPAAVARAAASCSFDEGTGLVSVTAMHGDVATISRLGDAIAVDGVACETATVTNTESIDVAFPDDPDTDTVVVDLSGGVLAPGATDEGEGSSEIEVDVTGMDGSLDTLRIVGTSGPDAFATSFLAVNLNADETVPDPDVTLEDYLSLELIAGDGDDELAADPFDAFARVTLLGGDGDDRLSGRLGGDDVLDAGPGRDVADYSGGNGRNLVWEESGEALFWAGSSDVVANVEVAVLSDSDDTVSYVGNAVGETWLGGSIDTVNVIDGSPGVSPGDRIIHGGPGDFDSIRFNFAPPDRAYVELSRRTLGGMWPATYRGFEYVFGGSSDDWFLLDHPDVYPTIVGEQGEDTIDLRSATEGFDLTLGQDTFGGGHWLSAFEFEVILGSEFGDVLLGPDSAGQDDTVTFYGFSGNDYLIGGDQADFLRGGPGADTLKGREGADTLSGAPGNDLLGGGYGPDELRGGTGDDVLLGGAGVDACVGGEGSDRVDCER